MRQLHNVGREASFGVALRRQVIEVINYKLLKSLNRY